jgi:fibronectin-binding autotransporter adhesin
MKANRNNVFLILSRLLCRTVFAVISLGAVQAQTTGNWNYNGTVAASLNWNTTGSWTGLANNQVPNAQGATANFTFNITAARTIPLNGDKTVGTMSIDDPTSSFFAYTLNAGTPSTSRLIFDVASGDATLNTATATNTATNVINAGITLNDPLVITTTRNNGVGGGLNLSGVITDGGSSYKITKAGNGALQLGTANTYDGGTNINAGRIQASNVASFGTGLVTVASGGQAFLATSGTFANDFTISGDGYVNTVDQGALNGALRYQGGAITTGTITLAGPARIGAFGASSTATLSGPLTGAFDLEINATSNASFTGNIVLLGNASGLEGTVTVSQGTLRLGTNSNLGGSVVVSDSANLYAENVDVAGSALIAENLTLGNSGSTTTGANLYIDPATNDALQVNGNVTLNGTNTVHLSGPITSASAVVMTYSGTLTGSVANLTLPGGLGAYRPGTGFTSGGGQIVLNLVQGEIKWAGAVNNVWNTTDGNWDDNGAATTFFNTDIVTFDETTIKARFVTNLANATNNDLIFAAKAGGVAGEQISIEYVNPGLPDSPISASVSGSAVLVSLATDSLGAIISTAADVKAAIEASAPVSALISVANAAGNDGSGLVDPLPFSFLDLSSQAISLVTSVSPADMFFDHSNIDYSITGAGSISGGGLLTKAGSGVLTLSTANTYTGGVMLSGGKIRVGNAAALGSGVLSMTTGAQLSSDGATARTIANPLTLSGDLVFGNATDNGALTMSGATTLAGNTTIEAPTLLGVNQTFSGVITDGASAFQLTTKGSTASVALSGANTYDGGTLIESGRILSSNVQSFGTGLVTVADGAQAFLTAAGSYANGFRIEGDGVSEPSGFLGAIRLQGATVAGPIGLTNNALITAHGNTGTLSGSITEVSVPCALELSNYSTGTDSTITVSGNNSYTLGTVVKGAIVVANSNNAFGTGPVKIESNGTAARVTRIQLGDNVTIGNDIILDSSANSGLSAVTSFAGDNATVSLATVTGDVEVLQSVGGGGHFASTKGSNSVLRVTGEITSPNDVSVVIRQGVVELGGGGNYTAMQIVDGTLRNVANDGLATNAVLSIGTSGTAGDAGIYNLNGFSQTLAGLIKGAQTATVVNNGASASTLTLDMTTSGTYAGEFAAGSAALNLVKTGTGTLTVSGNSSGLVGNLNVNQGGLNLTGTLGAGTFTSAINAGTILSGEGTFGGNLTVSGATIQANAATSSRISATGDLTTSSGITVDLTTPPITNDPIEIIACGGLLTSDAAHFTLTNASSYRNPQFQVNTNNVTLTLAAALDLTWTGVGGNTWDIATTSNWVDNTLTASKFNYLDNVFFGNSGGGTIDVPVTVATGSFAVNSNDNWLFQGAGTVQVTSLTKNGTGSVILDTPWAINGPVTLTAGSLQLSVPVAQSLTSALSGAGTLVKGSTAALTVTQSNTDFTGTTVISRGSLIPSTSTSLGTNPKITFGNADTLATDTVSLTLGSGLTVASPTVVVDSTCLDARITSTGSTMSAASITKKGTGRLRIGHASTLGTRTSYVTGTSSIIIEAGTLAGSSEIPFSTTTTVTMGNSNTGTAATILEIPGNQTSSNDVVTMQSPLALGSAAPNSEAIVRYAGGSVGSMSISSAIALNGRDIIFEHTGNVNPPNLLYNVTGLISGNGNVRMRGNNGTTIRLQGANTFTGDLYILSGRIQTQFGGTTGNNIPNTARVIMSPGATFSLSNEGETVRGLVGGAPTESSPTPALINQGRGDTNLCRLTVSDSIAANTHVFDGTVADRIITSPPSTAPMAITKAGAATQVLNGVHTYSGSTIVTGGTLEIGGAGRLGSGSYSAAITITSPGILKFNSTANQTLQTGEISSTGALVKDNTGTLTLTAANTFSGNITVDGGTLIGAGSANSPGVAVFGSRTNTTRVITITDGGTLQFNSGNILGVSHTAITAPKLVINSGGTVTNGGIATNNALNDIELNGGTLTSTTGHTGSSAPFTPVYGAWNLNGAITSTGTSTISTSDPTKGWIMLKVAGDKISNFNVVSGTLTVSAPVVDNPTDSNIGALTKSGTGTMVMSGVNTYTGATTVGAGTLALVGGSQTSPITVSSGASLGFTIGSPTISTSTFNLSAGTIKITGTPSAASHTLIASSAGITGTPVLDSPVPGYQLKVIGNSLVLEQAAGYSSWAGVNGAGANLNDDHDNDGVPNGVEYFLGGPTGNTTGFTALPGVTNTAGTLSVTWVMGSGYAGVYNTDFTVETSDTLTGTWTTESAPGNVTISGSNVTYTFPAPLSTKRFARLKVTGP